jgi:hypothetical protein
LRDEHVTSAYSNHVSLGPKSPKPLDMRDGCEQSSPLFEIALVLVRFDHVAPFIVNADQSVM